MAVLALAGALVLVLLGGVPSAHAEGDTSHEEQNADDAVWEYQESMNIGESNNAHTRSVGRSCNLKVNDPHNSGHQGTRINQTSFIRCTADVHYLKVKTTLQRWKCIWFLCWWGNDADSGEDPGYDTDFVRAHSNKECSPGKYRGLAVQTIVFNPGDLPVTAVGFGREINIQCN